MDCVIESVEELRGGVKELRKIKFVQKWKGALLPFDLCGSSSRHLTLCGAWVEEIRSFE